ncbi:MAG TPA: TIGR00282 family metallophosphoesterase [Oligoflexia bacterium]|nr:TIGR00282 family metallophosphoesterase [Oligoflexia bacterium]HMP47911.1 TIGR00282 family metallophosphoesterase [Oligoflexia bacterium]
MHEIIFVGDIVARPGRVIFSSVISNLRDKFQPVAVIVNGENASGGFGLDLRTADELFKAGADLITTGNHVWKKKDLEIYLEKKADRIIRPANYPPDSPGKGYLIFPFGNNLSLGLMNLMGRIFMNDILDCPFRKADELLLGPLKDCTYNILDFHAEATSEKLALAHHLDGRVSAIIGTHTHVQTADERILPKGSAYITDAGMCGPYDSVIGSEITPTIKKFISGRPHKVSTAKGASCFCGVRLSLDPESRKAVSISRIFEVIH